MLYISNLDAFGPNKLSKLGSFAVNRLLRTKNYQMDSSKNLGAVNVEHTMTLTAEDPGRPAGAWRHPIWHEARAPLLTKCIRTENLSKCLPRRHEENLSERHISGDRNDDA